jgi:hypothetical protein
MCDGAVFYVDDVCIEAQVLCDRYHDRGKGLADFDAPDIRDFQPARSSACFTAGTGPNANIPGSTVPMP